MRRRSRKIIIKGIERARLDRRHIAGMNVKWSSVNEDEEKKGRKLKKNYASFIDLLRLNWFCASS